MGGRLVSEALMSGQIDMTSGLKRLLFMLCGVCGNWFLYEPSEDFFQPS